MSEPDTHQMLEIREVCQFFGGKRKPLDKTTIYRWVRQGKLAKPLRMGPKTNRWRLSDCVEALAKVPTAKDLP